MKKRKNFEKYQHNKLSRGARVSEIKQYEELMNTRRSLRDFSKEEVEIEEPELLHIPTACIGQRA